MLRLLAQLLGHVSAKNPLKRNSTSNLPNVTLDSACYEAHGCAFATWVDRSLQKRSELEWTLAAWSDQNIPDYDPALGPAAPRILEMPKPKPLGSEPVSAKHLVKAHIPPARSG
jgi:hypothetical protein